MTGNASSGSMIPEEALRMVGRVYQQQTGVIGATEARRWAAAVGDLNPLYFDAEFARAHGYRDALVPPMYLSRSIVGVTPLGDLRPDGIPVDRMPDLPLPQRRMAGEESSEFFVPVYPGERVTSVRRLAQIEEKSGRSGPFVLVTWETEYSNEKGELVARIINSVICR